MNSIRI